MKLTEYQWEQQQKDRAQYVNWRLNCGALADYDRSYEFKVIMVTKAFPIWHKTMKYLLKAGWEICSYGQECSLFFMSGYFKKRVAKQQ